MAQLMASRLGTTSLDAYPQFAGGRLYAWICVIEFKSLVRDNFDRVGTYKKVFGSFGLMDVKRRGVGSILSYPMSQGSETRVYLSRHQRSRRVSQVRLMLEGHFALRAAFWLPLLALFNARVRLNWRGSLWPMSRQSRRHKRRCFSSLNGRPPIV
jgi:hypothetical protein